MLNSQVFDIVTKDQIVYLKIPSFEETGLVNHCFSTRIGGVSSGIFASMNLGYNRGDQDKNVEENFRRLCARISVNHKDLIFTTQTHEDIVLKVDGKDKGKTITIDNEPGVDGLVTNESKVPLTTFYADCVPLYFLDPVKKVIGLSHAGWRGTVKKIGTKTILKMIEEFGSSEKDILAAIGPSIGSCCFEVSLDVKEAFDKVFNSDIIEKVITEGNNGKYFIDLGLTNKEIMLEAGLLEDNITLTDLCTMCHKDTLFSHRGTNGQRGSLAAILELK